MVQAGSRNSGKIGLGDPGIPVGGEGCRCGRFTLQRAKRPFVDNFCVALGGARYFWVNREQCAIPVLSNREGVIHGYSTRSGTRNI